VAGFLTTSPNAQRRLTGMRTQCTLSGMTLEKWMEKKGLKSDADMAKLVPISRTQINRIRRRVCRPSMRNALALSAVTKIPVAKFLMGEA
jgi:transcriptional regulator with XRE-family HTH domain